jgi:ubiquitin C
LKETKDFFSLSADEKKKYFLPPRYGFVDAEYKQAFRLLTGPLAHQLPLPQELQKEVLSVCEALDSFSKDLIGATSEKLFGRSVDRLASEKNIPLLLKANNDKGQKFFGYGMLDIVEYFNNSSSSPSSSSKKRDFNVAAHADPGLFAISLKSTAAGLQMLDQETNSWIKVPNDCCVLWCGATAEEVTDGKIKAGWHKVEMHESDPRLTMWYEVSAIDQIPKYIQEQGMIATGVQHNTQSSGLLGGMQIFVKTLTGKTITLEVELSDTIEMSSRRFRTRKAFLQISRDWCLQANSWKTDEPSQTTTYRRSPLFILSSDFADESTLHLVLRRLGRFLRAVHNEDL